MPSSSDPEQNRRAGSFQKDALKLHYHTIPGENSGFAGSDGPHAGLYRYDGHYPMTNGVYNSGPGQTSDGTVRDSATRPKNVAVYYYIRIN